MSWETILRSKRAVAPRSPASWRMSIRRIDCPLVQSFGQSFYIHSAVSWPYHDPKSSRRWFMGEAGQRFQLWSCLATLKTKLGPSFALPSISRFAPSQLSTRKGPDRKTVRKEERPIGASHEWSAWHPHTKLAHTMRRPCARIDLDQYRLTAMSRFASCLNCSAPLAMT